MASGLDAARARRRFGSTANKDTCTRFKACRIVARPPPRRRGPHPRPMVKPAGNVAPLPCVVMFATLRHFLVWRAENLESWRDSAVVWYGACPLVGCLGGFLVDKLRSTPLTQNSIIPKLTAGRVVAIAGVVKEKVFLLKLLLPCWKPSSDDSPLEGRCEGAHIDGPL